MATVFDPVSRAKFDLRELVRQQAYADQHPEIWESLPLGSRRAVDRRISAIRSYLESHRHGRIPQRWHPTVGHVLNFVRKVHQEEVFREARLRRRRAMRG